MKTMCTWLAILVLAAALCARRLKPGRKLVSSICRARIVNTKDGQKAAAELEAKARPRKEMEGKQNEINRLKDQLQKGQTR